MNKLGKALKIRVRSGRATAGRLANRGWVQALGILAIAIVGVLGIPSSSTAVGTFAPTVTFETSTTRATAHPDARITVDNTGNTASVRSMRIDLPNGFWGSLAAVEDKCSSFVAGSGSPGGSDSCTPANKIGTVRSSATIDQSTATIDGDIYLVEPPNSSVAAGIGIKVQAKVGGVDLGYVRVLGVATVRGNGLGLRTDVTDIPNSITDAHGRTVNLHIDRMTVDLVSDLDGPNPPLLTNPSTCGTTYMTATVNPNPTLGAGDVVRNVPYPVMGCATVPFNPTYSQSFTSLVAGQETSTSVTVTLPEGNSTLETIDSYQPMWSGPNYTAFGAAADQCPSASATPSPPAPAPFNPVGCPPQAKVGTLTIITPLLPDPVTGNVYLINKTPLPWFGIDVNPSIPGNPRGVTLRLVGTTSMPKVDPACDPGWCQPQIRAVFGNLPDVPLTSTTLNLGGPPRPRPPHPVTGLPQMALSPNMLVNATQPCPPQLPLPGTPGVDDAETTFTPQSTSATQLRTQTFTLSGCDQAPQVNIISPVDAPDGSTTVTSPLIAEYLTAGADSVTCQWDSEPVLDPCPASPLAPKDLTATDGFEMHTFTVTATNATDTTTVTSTFYVEAAADPFPAVTITSPADGLNTQAPSVALTYTVTDGSDPTPSCDKASGSSQPLVAGGNAITVTCTDSFDVVGSASVTVFRDNTPPSITIAAPVNDSFTQADSTALTYTVADNITAGPTCDKTSGSSQALTAGSNTISVTCTDQAGNSATASVTVTRDSTAPATSFSTTPPASTSDTTPSFDFAADENSRFQCAISADDPSSTSASTAFLPCGPGTAGQSGSYTVPPADELFPGHTYTFSVRAQDDAGNVDVTPASVTFSVDVPFGPTLSVLSSTNVARAHPDLDITIDNLSHEDIKDVTVKLPDGFFGGLQGVQQICALALADAGNCPAGSKVGTIETEGVVDESVIRIDGEVFLTDPRQPGDAAALSIKVPAVIQSIDMGDIIVSARVVVRGDGQGMDTLVVQVPNSIDPAASGNTYDSVTFFDMRKMVMKMRTNPDAGQPLLTNPSSCDTGTFAASFTGYDSTTGTSDVPYPIAGCEALDFAPSLSASIKLPGGGAPNASDFQDVNLVATVGAQPGEAGLMEASVLMPKPLTMNVTKLPPLCEQAEYLLDACPRTTVIGTATATTPLLLAGDELSGPVYLLRGEGTVMPRLYVRLRGRLSPGVSVGIIGKTSFENQTQLRTVFKSLPDAPLNSFTMSVTNLLSTMKKPCALGDKYGYSMTGMLTGHNGKTAAVGSPFVFDCAGVGARYKFTPKGKRTKLDFALKTMGSQPKLKSVTIQFPKYLTMNKRALKRKLSLKVDGKRLKSKCFRYLKPDLLRLGLCGKSASMIELKFKSGSLNAGRKLRKWSKLRVTSIDTSKKTSRQSLNIFSKAFVSVFKLP